jgi:hypothetical protein
MVHIFPHWNWENMEGKKINVWSYTNCDEVELFLNDKSLGKKKRPAKQFPYSVNKQSDKEQTLHPEHLEWKVPYEPGTLRVEGIIDGKSVFFNKLETTGKAYGIKLDYMMEEYVDKKYIPELIADGRDIVVVRATIVDSENRTVPIANNKIIFSVVGEGKIIGVGNGNITSHEANKSYKRKAYNGLCAVVVQSTKNSGEINLKAESEGLKSAEITFSTKIPKPYSIAILSNPYTIKYNGDSSLISVQIRDKYGITIPAKRNVKLKIDGPAIFTNGKNIIEIQTEEGREEVEIFPTNQEGDVIITATGGNIIPSKTNLRVIRE